jgi:hypothetical protein
MALFMSLTSKYAGELAGLVRLCGYLPLAEIAGLRVEKRFEFGVDDDVQIFLTIGTKNSMAPRRHHRLCCKKLS